MSCSAADRAGCSVHIYIDLLASDKELSKKFKLLKYKFSPCLIAVTPRCPALHETPEDCPTCCCQSSANVEFYDTAEPEPTCTAPPAVFEAKFVSTWSGEATQTCHPTYYFPDAHWSWPTGISHKPEYELWDACMKDVSPGVATVSQTGSTCKLVAELYIALQNDAFLACVLVAI